MNDLKSKFRACLLGGAIGDALGYAVEFDSWSNIRAKHGARGITEYATHAYAPRGGFSDDTQMTLFTAEGLARMYSRYIARGTTSLRDSIEYAYLRWLHTQGRAIPDHINDGWLTTHRDLFARRAPGDTCLSALDDILAYKYHDGPEPPRNNSKGCGTVMRVAPVALAAIAREWTLEQAAMVTGAVAEITHHHPTSTVASVALVIGLIALLEGASKESAVRNMLAYATMLDDNEEFLACFDQLSAAMESDRDTAEVIDTMLGNGGWVAEDAVLIAVYAFLKGDGFDEILRIAVNHSGDSDSTGAIAGNLAGAFYGMEAIDGRKWLDELELRDVIDQVAMDLYDMPNWGTGEMHGIRDDVWAKYPGG